MQSEMASSTHSPAGSVPLPPATPIPLAPPLVPTVLSSTIPVGITSGMPLLCCVCHVVPPIPSGTVDI